MSQQKQEQQKPHQQKLPKLPDELVARIKKGECVIATMNVLKATYENHFGKNPALPCDILVTKLAHALHDDVVVISLDPPKNWTVRPGDSKKEGATPTTSPTTTTSSKTSSSSSSATAAASSSSPQQQEAEVEEEKTILTQPRATGYEGGPRHQDGRAIVDALIPDNETEEEQLERKKKRMSLPELLHIEICGADRKMGSALLKEWTEKLQPRGKVVYVVRRKKSSERLQSCIFYQQNNNNNQQQQSSPLQQEKRLIESSRWYRFKSYDQKYPFIAVYGHDIPKEFHSNADKYLFMIEIDKLGEMLYEDEENPKHWVETKASASGWFPRGKVVRSIGYAGTVEAESVAITGVCDIRDFDFDDEVNACVDESCPIPTKEELEEMGRRDLREEEFITTIDPATARDLDDALSIAAIPGGGYRVGVHIADVSHFVGKDNALDVEASQRCTSTYLVERVIPMLPRKLCEDYCSLNAGVDKFAFSGIWEFNAEGKQLKEWFGQSLIRNRCRMAYEDAQSIIDGDESGESLKFVNETAPREKLVRTVVDSVKMLYKLSGILRERRLEKGAIALGKKKLGFVFEDMNSRLAPIGFKFDVQKEANRLVEEFMLYANFRVAEKVVQFLPRVTLLRQHSPPVRKKLDRFVEQANRHGYTKFGSGGTTGLRLREALEHYKEDKNYDVLNFLVVICQSLAKYCCSSQGMTNQEYEQNSDANLSENTKEMVRKSASAAASRGSVKESKQDYEGESSRKKKQTAEERFSGGGMTGQDQLSLRHFALAAPFYCHFTSPIRRYADLMTHRQLLLALDIEKAIKDGKTNAQGLVDVHNLDHSDYYYDEDEVLEIANRCNKKKEQAKKAGGMSSNLFLSIFLDALRLREERRLAESRCTAALGEEEAGEGEGEGEKKQQDEKEESENKGPQEEGEEDEKEEEEELLGTKFYCSGVIVRLMAGYFTVHLRELSCEVDIMHNAKAQRWEGENDVDEDSGDFEIKWRGRQEKEQCSIFTEFIGEVTTIQNPITQINFVVLPPNRRSGKKLITSKLRL